MSKVFISGSIKINQLPKIVEKSLDKIINNDMEILVGDADGIDKMVQNYCKRVNYSNVTVYSIYSPPRYVASKFKTKCIVPKIESKKERELQKEKDEAMTLDSDYSFIIWDGKSKGSYSNIIRAIENSKKLKVFLIEIDDFLQQNKISISGIEQIFRKNNGYSAAEVVEYLKNHGEDFFLSTKIFNKTLLEHHIIKKEDGVYYPIPEYENLFLIDRFKGKSIGIRFTNSFITWVEKWIKTIKPPEEKSLFQ